MPAMDLGRTGGKTTSGEDIRGTLSQMAEQIAEAERRHLAQMRDMQQRLSDLTGQAERTSAQMPAEDRFEPAAVETRKTLARIGDGIAGLQARAAAPVSSQSLTSDGDDAWDIASAEALTRMYEAEAPQVIEPAPAFFLQDPLPVEPAHKAAVVQDAAPSLKKAAPQKIIHVAPEPETATAALLPATAQADLSSLAVDRDWLDERIKDIAARVEDTLARNNPMDRIVELDRRFGAFEQSFGQAMADVATRADLDGLRVIEAEIGELAKRLDDTRNSLRRIDGIETELRKLSAIAEHAQSAEPAAEVASFAVPQMPDVTALVESTAERVAERFAAAVPQAKSTAAEGHRFDEMQAMIATIAEERRREEHQTASMLDTMQEALVRLIDRVDQMDRAPGQPMTAPPVSAAPEPEAALAPDPVVYVENERGPYPGRRATDHEAYVQSGVRHHDPELPEVPVPASAAGLSPAPEQPEAHEQPEARMRQRPVRPANPPMSAAGRAPQTRARATEEQPAAAPKPATRPGPRQLAQPTVIAMPDESPAEEKDQSTLAKRGILVAGIGIAIIAVGLLFEFFVKDRLLSSGAPKVAERAPVTQPAAATPVAREEGPTMAPRFAEDAEGPTPAAARQGDGNQQVQPDPRQAPAATPGRGATDQPPANQQPRPRSQLETSTDQPGQAVAQVPSTAPTASAARVGPPPVTTSSVQGITLQHPGPISMSPPGMASQPPQQQPPAPKQAGGITTSALPASSAQSMPGSAIELPPALIGPLSLRLAAQKGDPEAQFEVAVRFAEGKGVKQDFKQALAWYERSAHAGFIPSQYRLGTLFERGVSGKPDIATARQWYERAANEGNVKAMHNLAVLAASAQNGQTPDYAAAAQWFVAAAERGLSDSQFNLGVLHENGLGVERDPAAAYKWYALAAAKGDAEATKRRDAVLSRLLPGQALALSDEVAKWRAKPASAAANDARAAGAALRARAEMAAAQADDQSARQAPPAGKRVLVRPSGHQPQD